MIDSVYTRMLSGGAIFMALLSVSYVNGITGMVESYAEQAAHSLDEVADMRRFDLAIRLNSPEWCPKGIRIFAFQLRRFYWRKRPITWGLTNDPVNISKTVVIGAIEAACEKWSRGTSLSFRRVSPMERPDIRIIAIPKGRDMTQHLRPHIVGNDSVMDLKGAYLEYYDNTDDWATVTPQWVTLFRAQILYIMGLLLGLGNSTHPGAVMYRPADGYKRSLVSPTGTAREINLAADDIAAIQAKYPISGARASPANPHGLSTSAPRAFPTNQYRPSRSSARGPRMYRYEKPSTSSSSETSGSSETSTSSEKSSSSN